jgi:hypothetical protein
MGQSPFSADGLPCFFLTPGPGGCSINNSRRLEMITIHNREKK